MNKTLAAAIWLGLTSVVCCGQTVKPMVTLEAPVALNFAVVCEGGESVVGVAGAHDVFIWSLPSGARRTIGGFTRRISPFGVSCNRKALAIAATDGTVVIFDPAGVERQRIDLKAEPAALAFSTDGTMLAAATIYSPVQLWDVASGKRLWVGTTDFGNSKGTKISSDGNMIVAADGDTHLRAYDRKGKLLYTAETGLLEPFDLSISADGKTLSVAGAEGVIELHDLATGNLLKKSASAGKPIFLLSMAPVGNKVIGLRLDDLTLSPLEIAYWNTDRGNSQNLPIDAKTILGFGRGEKSLLLVRQEAPGKISVESVE